MTITYTPDTDCAKLALAVRQDLNTPPAPYAAPQTSWLIRQLFEAAPAQPQRPMIQALPGQNVVFY